VEGEVFVAATEERSDVEEDLALKRGLDLDEEVVYLYAFGAIGDGL
jgi:hypothetical protein